MFLWTFGLRAESVIRGKKTTHTWKQRLTKHTPAVERSPVAPPFLPPLTHSLSVSRNAYLPAPHFMWNMDRLTWNCPLSYHIWRWSEGLLEVEASGPINNHPAELRVRQQSADEPVSTKHTPPPSLSSWGQLSLLQMGESWTSTFLLQTGASQKLLRLRVPPTNDSQRRKCDSKIEKRTQTEDKYSDFFFPSFVLIPGWKFKFKETRRARAEADGEVIICLLERLAEADSPGHPGVCGVSLPLNPRSSLTAAQVKGEGEVNLALGGLFKIYLNRYRMTSFE